MRLYVLGPATPHTGKILAEAREHAVTVVTEGQAAVVMQNRAAAARQAHAEALLRRLAPLVAYLLESDTHLPHELRWVKELHPKNFAQFRRARAPRGPERDAYR